MNTCEIIFIIIEFIVSFVMILNANGAQQLCFVAWLLKLKGKLLGCNVPGGTILIVMDTVGGSRVSNAKCIHKVSNEMTTHLSNICTFMGIRLCSFNLIVRLG